ncbi:hypothetical protein COY28_04130, partial [Candidatus Woesearchaeota archaeon CG_4_10_14_0_2_um_filter_57_5]
MNTQSIDVKDNALYGRKDIKAILSFTGVFPKRKDVREHLIKESKEKHVLVISIEKQYGQPYLAVQGRAYPDLKAMRIAEPMHMLKRNGIALEDAKSEKKPAESKEEKAADQKPAEEKK